MKQMRLLTTILVCSAALLLACGDETTSTSGAPDTSGASSTTTSGAGGSAATTTSGSGGSDPATTSGAGGTASVGNGMMAGAGGGGMMGNVAKDAEAFCADYGTTCSFGANDKEKYADQESCVDAYVNVFTPKRRKCVAKHLDMAKGGAAAAITHCPHAAGMAPCDK